MLLRKIKLKNFRNFKNCEIEFSCDPDKNFTIVLGKNTYGKTTLIKAFLWCLYRENLFVNKSLLNSDVERYMSPGEIQTVSVELELTHKAYTYKITTKETYTKNASRVLSVKNKAMTSVIKVDDSNSYYIDQSKADEEIEGILRSELKEYFFFDGENNSIEKISDKKNLTDAVSNILGLSHIEMLRDYFDPSKSESVTTRLKKEIITDNNGELSNWNELRDNWMQKKESYQNTLTYNKSELEKLDAQKTSLEQTLDANRDVESDQLKKHSLESDLTRKREQKEADMKRLIQSINASDAFVKVLFANSFLKFDFRTLCDNSSFRGDDSYKGINEEAVNELIKRGRCICGAEIKDGNDAYKHLIEARQHMEPHDYGKYISDFVSAEESNVYNAQTTLSGIESIANSILDSIQAIEDDEEELRKVKKRLEGRMDVGEIQKSIRNIENQMGQKTSEIRNLEKDKIPEADRYIELYDEKIKKSAVNNEKNNFTNRCITYADYVYRVADKKMKSSKETIHKALQDEVGQIFSSMYHGNRGIKIDDNFKASTYVLSNDSDTKIDGSTGLGTVMNYSFVAGLLNLAKQSIINGYDDELADPELSNETFPLVMDAPFSNTDEVHIRNICETLPKYCDQIIMFVMEKDFRYARDTIRGKIGKIYELEQRSETDSIIKEEEI